MNPQYPIRLNLLQTEIIECLINHGVVFLVIGGWAIASYIPERETSDIDVLISRDSANAVAAEAALRQVKNIAFPKGLNLQKMLSEPEKRVCIPDDSPNKLADILTSIDGVDFEACYRDSKSTLLSSREVRVANAHDLLSMKEISLAKATNPAYVARDKADIVLLKKFLGLA